MPATVEMEEFYTVSKCQVDALTKAAQTYNPDDCAEFYRLLRNVQAGVVNSYQMVAHLALKEPDPKKAAECWNIMVRIGDITLRTLSELRQKNQSCEMTGIMQLYDLVLDYRGAAQEKYFDNLQDSQCPPIPEEIFPEMS